MSQSPHVDEQIQRSGQDGSAVSKTWRFLKKPSKHRAVGHARCDLTALFLTRFLDANRKAIPHQVRDRLRLKTLYLKLPQNR
ncbi:hypothetical protein [Bradyrhizobium valentinum]|uniref:hypothetical protein n=1 Tax=Bradyrhizobium valentinum TaxID=1518501 RepID=UPI0012E3C401|nr:hypothetical protein [Bradyrhizobium valentinum]